jgi:chromosomal replication initiation ATPase DnaA
MTLMLSLFRGEIVVPERRSLREITAEIQVPEIARTMREITAEFAALRRFGVEELRGPSQEHRVAHPRQELFAIIYAQGRHSLPQIGAGSGKRDT